MRQLSDAQAAWRNYLQARKEAAEVRGSMRWKTVGDKTYLVRTSPAGAETSLGPRDARTEALFDSFHARKVPAEARLKANRPSRDPLKAPKDRLQTEVVRQLWEEYLQHLEGS